jgi:CRISPR-associated endoribonuclease Cas6
MRLTIKCKPETQLTLPLGHQQILQGYIYRTLSDSDFAEFLHEKGYVCRGRIFMLFTFSRLQGKFRINKRDKTITFEEDVSWQVSSVLPEFIQDFGQSLLTSPHHQLHGQPLHIEEVTYTKPRVSDHNTCKVSMLSPITIHSTYETKEGKKITQFFRPTDAVYQHLIEENLKKKYEAYHQHPADEMNFRIRPLKVGERDKVITRFKGFIINGWNGVYEMSGSPELVQFALNVGIGARNSQGFGMAELRN